MWLCVEYLSTLATQDSKENGTGFTPVILAPQDSKMNGAGCRWLTPVILATQEAESRKIEVQGRTEQIVQANSSW
jgi:hypothetical protein